MNLREIPLKHVHTIEIQKSIPNSHCFEMLWSIRFYQNNVKPWHCLPTAFHQVTRKAPGVSTHPKHIDTWMLALITAHLRWLGNILKSNRFGRTNIYNEDQVSLLDCHVCFENPRKISGLVIVGTKVVPPVMCLDVKLHVVTPSNYRYINQRNSVIYCLRWNVWYF